MNWIILPALSALSVLAVLDAFAGTRGMNGTFVLSPDKSDNVDQAIESTISEMNFVIRPIARERLRNTNELYGSVTIEVSPDQIEIGSGSYPPIRTSADGKPIKWKRGDGEEFDVSTPRLSVFIEIRKAPLRKSATYFKNSKSL